MLDRFIPPLIKDAAKRLRARDEERRTIITTEMPLRAYVNRHVWPGSRLLATGHWEVETEKLLAANIRPGDVVLDVGANEGILSAYAGKLAGPTGYVIAIEPQSALRPYIEINLALNDVRRAAVYTAALGGDDGSTLELNLYPSTNTGQSSFVKKPRLGWTTLRRKTETVTFVSPRRILRENQLTHFDLIKVDVEGFEVEVVEVLLPLIREGLVKKLLLDYHAAVLARRGASPEKLHRALLDAGLVVITGEGHLRGDYTLYGLAVG